MEALERTREYRDGESGNFEEEEDMEGDEDDGSWDLDDAFEGMITDALDSEEKREVLRRTYYSKTGQDRYHFYLEWSSYLQGILSRKLDEARQAHGEATMQSQSENLGPRRRMAGTASREAPRQYARDPRAEYEHGDWEGARAGVVSRDPPNCCEAVLDYAGLYFLMFLIGCFIFVGLGIVLLQDNEPDWE